MRRVPSRDEMKQALAQQGVSHPPVDVSPIDVVSNSCIYLEVCDDIKFDRYDLETFSRVYAVHQGSPLPLIRSKAREQFDRQSIRLPWDEGLMV